jgi:hypothetical protein
MAITMWPLPSSGLAGSAGLSRPRAAASRSMKRTAARTAVSASSVTACVTCITGQTPPISAKAMSSAASAFMRRNSRIASDSSLEAATALSAFASSSARCASGVELSSTSSRSGSATARSHRNDEPSARPSSSPSSFGASAMRRLSVLPAALRPISVSHPATRVCAALRSISRGASASASTSVLSSFADGLFFLRTGRAMACHSRAGGG